MKLSLSTRFQNVSEIVGLDIRAIFTSFWLHLLASDQFYPGYSYSK